METTAIKDLKIKNAFEEGFGFDDENEIETPKKKKGLDQFGDEMDSDEFGVELGEEELGELGFEELDEEESY